MKKIRYNIAGEKKIHTRKIVLLSSLLFLLSLACIAAGIWRLSAGTRQQRDEVDELNILREKSSDVRKMIAGYQSKIDEVRKKWGEKINFANALIDQKKFSMVKKLNLLEDLIPDGVFLNNLSMVNAPKAGIQIGCLSGSFKKLMVLYKNLSGYGLSIKKESVLKDGMVHADLAVKIRDEKN
jgi:Tfp pilus assembly protein PilN